MTLVRRLRLGARLGACFAVVLVLLGVVVAIGVIALQRQSDSAGRVRDLQTLRKQVDEQKYYDGDISGWQIAYAWDAYRLGPQQAVDPKSDNRAGFLADADLLKTLLAGTRTDLMTGDEQAIFADLQQQWASFFDYDTQIAALFGKGQIDAGNKLILGASYDIYYKIVQGTDKLVGSVAARAEQATRQAQSSAAAARNAMLIAFALAVLAAVVLTVIVTRSVVRPAGRVMGALRSIASGNLGVRLDDTGQDELSDMARAVDTAAQGVRATIVEISDDARRRRTRCTG
jgi:methyl-accepting chemotaxis protein